MIKPAIVVVGYNRPDGIKRLLNSILHPLIESEVKERIDHYTRLGEKYIVYDYSNISFKKLKNLLLSYN